jgi:hypothetical protein
MADGCANVKVNEFIAPFTTELCETVIILKSAGVIILIDKPDVN